VPPSDDQLLERTGAMLLDMGAVDLHATLPLADAPSSAKPRLLPALRVLEPGESGAAGFSVGAILGEGGMGLVSEAHEHVLERPVAIKRLRPSLHNNEAASSLLIEEAIVTGGLEHPNVVPVHALGADGAGRPAIVMKRLDGVPWRTLIHDTDHHRLIQVQDRLRFHLEVLMQVCNALHYAHSRGIVHRDVKPENVIVGSYGEVYVLDWGASFVASRHGESEALVGTLAYMAPEMLLGSGAFVTAATDVYLLGATLHELLTGVPPHAASDIEAALLSIHRAGDVVYPPDAPAELGALCHAAMHRDPNARPASALAFKEAIERYLDHRGSYALAAAATKRLGQLMEVCLADSPERGLTSRLYIECCFGYRQALDAWVDNPAARSGLQQAGEIMLRFELGRRNYEGACAVLEQLPNATADHREDVEALRRERDAEGRDVERLRDIARQHDPTEASGARAASALATGVVLAALFVALGRAYPRAQGLSHQTIASVALSLGVALAGAVYALRHKLLATRINRYLSASIFAITGTCVMVHLIGGWLDAPVVYGLAADLMVSGAVVTTVGANLHAGLVAVGFVYLAGAAAAGLIPEHVLEVVAATFLVSHVVVAITWRTIAASMRE
jgi:eukaryotic-like serine/threonine-protein kinase